MLENALAQRRDPIWLSGYKAAIEPLKPLCFLCVEATIIWASVHSFLDKYSFNDTMQGRPGGLSCNNLISVIFKIIEE
jgi:hypothetical protein